MFIVQVPYAKSTICIWLYTATEDVFWIQTWQFCKYAMFFKMQWNFFTICLVFSCCCYYYYYCNYYPQLFVVVIIVIIFCSMVISFQIHSMKMFSTLFAVILMPLMLMTSSLPIMLDFQGTYLLFNVSLPYFLYWY